MMARTANVALSSQSSRPRQGNSVDLEPAEELIARLKEASTGENDSGEPVYLLLGNKVLSAQQNGLAMQPHISRFVLEEKSRFYLKVTPSDHIEIVSEEGYVGLNEDGEFIYHDGPTPETR